MKTGRKPYETVSMLGYVGGRVEVVARGLHKKNAYSEMGDYGNWRGKAVK